MRLLLLFVICSLLAFAQEEEMPFAQEELLLKSDLIVLAKTRSDQGKTFKVIQDKRFMLVSPENNLPLEPIVDKAIDEILDTKPVPNLGLNGLIMKVSEKATAYLYSLGIFFEGTIYVERIIEKDSSVSFAKTKKGIIKHLDVKGEEFLLESKWNQGLDRARQTKMCSKLFPIKLG